MDLITTIIMSTLLGLIPEVTFFTMFLIYTKNLKEKKVMLWFLVTLAYILCMFIQRYKVVYYILFIILVYLVLKILYKKKTQIIDIFVFSLSFCYVCFIGFITSRFVNNNYINYYICFIINRILLFLPFIFKNKFNILYKKYCGLWNRNYDKKQPIKSITLRNISLIILNGFIFLLNIATVCVINTFQ